MTNTPAPAKKQCFVLSPIGDPESPVRKAADTALRHLIKKALDADFEVARGDADVNPGAITPRIVTSIREADLIVADMTGLNANVFYELAIAHGYNIPTVHIQQAGDKTPFDVKDMRVVRYDTSDPDKLEEGQKTLRSYAAYAVANAEKLETPLSQAQRFMSVSESADPVAESNVQVLEALEDLASDVRRALRRSNEADPVVPVATEAQRADVEVMRGILDKVHEREGLMLADLEYSITANTSLDHDNYVRHLSQDAGAPANVNFLERSRFILDPTMRSRRASADRRRGEQPPWEVDEPDDLPF